MRAAVIGSPIEQSKSPDLHNRAYHILGLEDWNYTKVEVAVNTLGQFIERLDDSWAGFSITMPLKEEVIQYGSFVDAAVLETQAANTAVYKNGKLSLYNTDVYGITESFKQHGVDKGGCALILGSGATARSAVYAAKLMECTTIFVASRTQADWIVNAGAIWVQLKKLETTQTPDIIISTLPWKPAQELLPQFYAGINYFQTTPTLECAFPKVLGSSIDGYNMLINQAIKQIELMTGKTIDFKQLLCNS
ncbi:shikimate 5-dehydrogenase [Actinomycetota bacterium]|nr:shikimate 5-dehydrogenase [Actinomycetota bacterium]